MREKEEKDAASENGSNRWGKRKGHSTQRGINKSMLMQVWRFRPGHILRCNNTAHFNCKCRFYNCTNCDQPYIKVCPAWLRLSLCHCCASAPHPNATVPSSLHLPLS